MPPHNRDLREAPRPRGEADNPGRSAFMPFLAYQNVDAEHPIGKLGHLLPVGVQRRRESRIVTSL